MARNGFTKESPRLSLGKLNKAYAMPCSRRGLHLLFTKLHSEKLRATEVASARKGMMQLEEVAWVAAEMISSYLSVALCVLVNDDVKLMATPSLSKYTYKNIILLRFNQV